MTPDIYSSGALAQSMLDLFSTPTGYFAVPISNIDSISYSGKVPGGVNGFPGGGTEVLVPHPVSISGAKWYPIGP